MKIKHVFDLIFSDDNLYEAIQDASKGRRYNKDVLRVQHDIWNVIEQIQQDVRSGKYTIDKYYIFYVYEPKKRMIMSITFYHRIVQWAIYRVINPLLVKGYIKDTYGCIPGRGSLAAMQRLRYWIKSVEHKPGTWYYLKLDISKYFYRISHEVLKEILARKIKDQQLLQVLLPTQHLCLLFLPQILQRMFLHHQKRIHNLFHQVLHLPCELLHKE